MRSDQVFFWVNVSGIGGVAYGSFFVPALSIFLLCLALLFAWMSVFPNKKIGYGIIFLGVFIATAIFAYETRSDIQSSKIFFGKEVSGIARVGADPKEKSFFREVRLHFEHCDETICPVKDVLWQVPLEVPVAAGQKFQFSCRLEPPENFSPDFDYRMYLLKEGVGFLCHDAIYTIVERDTRGRVFELLYWPKHRFEEALERSISEPEAGLAKGLILGGSDYLSRETNAVFQRVGLSHIVAVSGYNITLVAQCFLTIGILFGLWRKHALWVAFFCICLFVLMIGMPASAVRAGVMAGIAFAAAHTGRLTQSLSVLVFAALAMLCVNPLLLRYDVGFELSFLAALGIIIGSVWWESFFSKTFPGKSVAEIFWLTCMVEIFVVPIILYQFHMFSPLVLLANTLVLPLIPYAMAFSFLTGALYLVIPGAQTIFAWIEYVILSGIMRMVETLGSFSFSYKEIGSLPVGIVFVWYLFVFFGIVIIERRRKKILYAKAFSLS